MIFSINDYLLMPHFSLFVNNFSINTHMLSGVAT